MYKKEHFSIKSLSVEDRPREKLYNNGKASLSNSELLAIILGSGNKKSSAIDLAKEILNYVDNDLNKLAQLSISDLQKFNGVGSAKAISVIAALELGKRKNYSDSNNITTIKSSKNVFEIFYPLCSDLNIEEFWVLYLNRGNRILKKQKISQGGISGTVIDSRLIIKEAVLLNSSGIILIHNHPSGNTSPSESDINITKKIKTASSYFDINTLDHIIIGNKNYYSFADEGII